ncbi:hypothetical protein chiPu_0030609, partial [Chiloscyllium punctatum]|nr:hypothetical protein [Chiloscyllium punctatum]
PSHSQVSGPTLSVVTAQVTGAPSEHQRKLEHQKKQEKANRIVAEAIARAKARGEQNIPRVLGHNELSGKTSSAEGDEKRRKKKGSSRPKEGDGKRSRCSTSTSSSSKAGSKSKGKAKPRSVPLGVGSARTPGQRGWGVWRGMSTPSPARPHPAPFWGGETLGGEPQEHLKMSNPNPSRHWAPSLWVSFPLPLAVPPLTPS